MPITEPKCKNHPERPAMAHYKGYSVCKECFDKRAKAREALETIVLINTPETPKDLT